MTGTVTTSRKSSPEAIHITTAIPTALYVLAWIFPICINIFKGNGLDAHNRTALNIDQVHAVDVKDVEVERDASVSKQGLNNKGVSDTIERAS